MEQQQQQQQQAVVFIVVFILVANELASRACACSSSPIQAIASNACCEE
jgi:hypothetical protein